MNKNKYTKFFEKTIPINSIKELTLPTVDEIKNLDKDILNFISYGHHYSGEYWTQTSCSDNIIRVIDNDGRICYSQPTDYGLVRPILRLNDDFLSKFKVGDKVSCFDLTWIVISNDSVLKRSCIADRKRFDSSGRADYEKSELKKYLEEKLQELIEATDPYGITYTDDISGVPDDYAAKDEVNKQLKKIFDKNPDCQAYVFNYFTGQMVEIKK